jgi:hypothetical protein
MPPTDEERKRNTDLIVQLGVWNRQSFTLDLANIF